MFIHRKDPLAPVGGTETPERVALDRRAWLKRAGLASVSIGAIAGGMFGWRRWRGGDEEVVSGRKRGHRASEVFYPAMRDARFVYDRPETVEAAAARYTNFYEFSALKRSWRLVDNFTVEPWTVTITGLCRQPRTWSVDDLLARYRDQLVERQYRHRCVETWAMAIPWTGIPLARLIADADPLPEATHVRFTSFHRPAQAPGIRSQPRFPWPYTEGLTLAEATNALTLLATGMYGHPLLKQHGAPLRLVVPWKYGYKSIKSIERIEFLPREPATFWSTLMPEAYPFQSNVKPDVPRPWPQHRERMLGTGERFPTLLYNGYAEYVASLYPRGATRGG